MDGQSGAHNETRSYAFQKITLDPSNQSNEAFDFHALLGVQKGEKVPMFKWDYSFKRLFPRSTSSTKEEDEPCRLNRSEVWNKYGCSLHFFTLEFEKEDVEAEFIDDYLRRNKGFVEYGSLAMAVTLTVLSLKRFVEYSYFDEPIYCAAPIFALQYLMLISCRAFVYRYFQLFLVVFGFISTTLMVCWAVFGEPYFLHDYNRATDTYCLDSRRPCVQETVESSASILIFMVVMITVYRMRFCSFTLMMIYFIILYEGLTVWASCALQPPESGNSLYENARAKKIELVRKLYGDCMTTHLPNFRNTMFTALLLAVLSYTLEILQRKDFIQATMVLKESRRSDELLHNILPPRIVKNLKATGAEATSCTSMHGEVTILFTDVVSFTCMSTRITSKQLVELLNAMFNSFDNLANDLGVAKIKTIGDCYMCAVGIPDPNPMHAKAMCRFAILMLEKIKSGVFRNPATNAPIELRVGVHSGPAVAGVIGQKKFAYDVWGDAVNTASRMESNGAPNRVHCSEATKELIQDAFECEARDPIKVKGKGMMQTYFVNGEKSNHAKFRSYKVVGFEDLQTRKLADGLEYARLHLPVEEINSMISELACQILQPKNIPRQSSRSIRSQRSKSLLTG
eukprot:GEMP01004857.1.p1 GENE.GEMP01004857.1~~GEMP01004857.1.p1  ORF type:complete len:625 (+),score=78.13 GEMP01004857.1:53-1927(+)